MKRLGRWFVPIFFITLISLAAYANKLLHILYNNRAGSALRRSLVVRPTLSKLVGQFADMRMSRFLIKPFIKKYNININEARRTNPSEYSSLNDFFTRKLKPATRPIDHNAATIISPADGILYAIETIEPDTELFVKGKTFDIKKFLQSEKQAQQFYGGTLIVIYLAPCDYHRFHFPCDGVPSKPKLINGIYESVQPIAFNAGIQSLTENERQVSIIKTEDYGTIALVSVGALCVGRITQTYKPGQYYAKGDEAGYFSFGGSTLVLFFEKNKINLNSALKFQSNRAHNSGIPIKMGQQIGIKK